MGEGIWMVTNIFEDKIDILLVEDNLAHAELVKRGLENAYPTANLLHVTDGEQALDFLLRQDGGRQPALILLDIRLPKLNGLEVLKAIRSLEQKILVPIVILTSSDADRDLKEAYKYCVSSYLVKPLDLQMFMKLMNDVSRYWLSWNNSIRD